MNRFLSIRRRHTAAGRPQPFAGRVSPRLEVLEDRYLLSVTLVRDITPGAGGSNLAALTSFNGALNFGHTTSTEANLWQSDGTEEGTIVRQNHAPASFQAMRAGDYLYYTTRTVIPPTNAQSWFLRRMDSSGQVEYVASFSGRVGTSLGNLTIAGDRLYFTGRNGQQAGAPPMNLYQITGTAAPVRVATTPNNPNYTFRNLTAFGTSLFLTTNRGNELGEELYFTSGSGLSLVRDINPGSASSALSDLVMVNDILYFVADDGEYGRELWRSDGTEAGTYLVKDINPGPASAFGGSIGFLTGSNGLLYFSADNGKHGVELWTSDGTEEGTALVADIEPGPEGSWPVHFTEFNGVTYFAAVTHDLGYELWVSDGSVSGTYLVADINPGSASSSLDKPLLVNGLLYFSAEDADAGRELWRTDGTGEGTIRLDDINPGLASSSPESLTEVNGTLFFTAAAPGYGRELWKVDPGSAPSGGSESVELLAALFSAEADRLAKRKSGFAVSSVTDDVSPTEPWETVRTWSGR